MRVRLISVFLALSCALFSSLYGIAPTAEGVQCPTATVQQITVPIKSTCGCVVGYQTRAPKPGEKGFMQCRCNEKRSEQQATTGSQKVTWFPAPHDVALTLSQPIREQEMPQPLVKRNSRWINPPEHPPAARLH
ncbi:MAG: hypothetical protein JSS72_04190 [Armatimonadetes bacterium]|nr:hypothetical protein [Armatimonadota bacterium]